MTKFLPDIVFFALSHCGLGLNGIHNTHLSFLLTMYAARMRELEMYMSAFTGTDKNTKKLAPPPLPEHFKRHFNNE